MRFLDGFTFWIILSGVCNIVGFSVMLIAFDIGFLRNIPECQVAFVAGLSLAFGFGTVCLHIGMKKDIA